MIECKTVVVIQDELFEWFHYYRQFLEKSEFGTVLKNVRFISESSAGGQPLAGFFGVRECLYVYGEISGCQYQTYYNRLVNVWESDSNPQYYMLFCQQKHNTCGSYESAGGSVKKPFSIGILEHETYEDDKSAEVLRDENRVLKLLALTMSICVVNNGYKPLTFSNYYVTANVHLDYENIYYAILYELSGYAETVKYKEEKIKANEELIEQLDAKKPKMCHGNYRDVDLAEHAAVLSSFADYADMQELRRDMAIACENGKKAAGKNITDNIDVARKALAVAEESMVTRKKNGKEVDLSLDDPTDFEGYMSTRDADEKEIPVPNDLLDKTHVDLSFDAEKIQNLLPLADELNASASLSGWKAVLISLLVVLLFVVSGGAVYAVRYFMNGMNGATFGDLIYIVGIPAVLMLLAGFGAFIMHLLMKLFQKQVFKEMYDAVNAFLKAAVRACEAIKAYIDKYLTVYYNYHIKHARVSALKEEIIIHKKDIEALKVKAGPIDSLSELVCQLGGTDFKKPDTSFAIGNKDYATMPEAFAAKIRENCRTEVNGHVQSTETCCVWVRKIVYEIGNINGGAQ